MRRRLGIGPLAAATTVGTAAALPAMEAAATPKTPPPVTRSARKSRMPVRRRTATPRLSSSSLACQTLARSSSLPRARARARAKKGIITA